MSKERQLIMSQPATVHRITSDVEDFLHSGNILDSIGRDLTELGVIGEHRNKSLLYLAAISRRLENPLAIRLWSPASSGKSQLARVIANLQPPEETKILSRVTRQSLYYIGRQNPDALAHHFVYLAESEGSHDASYALKVLLSEKSLCLQTVIAGEPIEIELRGPIAYIETGVEALTDVQVTSRMFQLEMDVRGEQTRAVQRAMAYRAMQNNEIEDNAIVSRHREAQKHLSKSTRIIVPFADKIKFPSHTELARREFAKFLSVIESCAYLHQFNRKRKQFGKVSLIIATKDDYEIARGLVSDVIVKRLFSLPANAELLLNAAIRIVQRKNNESTDGARISRHDLVGETNLSLRQVRYWSEYLVDAGYMSALAGSKGKEYLYELSRPMTGGQLENISLGK
ncbi:MAG: hypothetical protein M1339_05160 [Bacteroidetes bacterium]|nr:hypothetical protein [Bacteroidota bacterium]